jgi:hypothetical protein
MTEQRASYTAIPEDLTEGAIKAARRLQGLPEDKVFLLFFAKVKGLGWWLAVVGEDGAKVERITADGERHDGRGNEQNKNERTRSKGENWE